VLPVQGEGTEAAWLPVMDTIGRISTFFREVVTPAFAEVAAAPRLAEDYRVLVVAGDRSGTPSLSDMIKILRQEADDDEDLIFGDTLVIEDRDPFRRVRPYFGWFLTAPLCSIAGDDVYVAPRTLYQMKFDGKLHGFQHRYDREILHHRIGDVTRLHILNHVLDSFTFYRMNAYADSRPW
jgi:hypothetical protein